MMKSEFENLAGREVTNEQYRAIETLYMSSNLEKAEFVKSIRTMLKSIPQPERKKDIKRMVVRDRSGYRKTPNGCYYHIEYVELVDIDIKTGKYIIKPLEEKDFEQLNHSDKSSSELMNFATSSKTMFAWSCFVAVQNIFPYLYPSKLP